LIRARRYPSLKYSYAKFLIEQGRKDAAIDYLKQAAGRGEPAAIEYLEEIGGNINK
jgi:hypothetical protein